MHFRIQQAVRNAIGIFKISSLAQGQDGTTKTTIGRQEGIGYKCRALCRKVWQHPSADYPNSGEECGRALLKWIRWQRMLA
jgi:hypothetical protein